MRTAILILLLLPALTWGQTYDGFSLENGDLVWSGEYRYEGDVRDALPAHLGTADGVQLANYQPQDKLVGKARLKPATSVKAMLLANGDLGYSFGFTVIPVQGGYVAKATNCYFESGNIKMPLGKGVPNEAALSRMAQKGKLKDLGDMFRSAFELR